MAPEAKNSGPDSSALRVALWRALHLQIDAAPHIFEDEFALKLAAPGEGWQQRPDMHPQGTMGYRASIVGRARFIEDLVLEQAGHGVGQYVILGAGLDSFAQRRPGMAAQVKVFEIDQPGTQEWKRRRLMELGLGISPNLSFVPVDFEAGEAWWEKLAASGFDAKRPAVFASTGVSMYLSKEANRATLRQIASFAGGSTLAMTFLLPLELIEAQERAQHQMVYERAAAAGTPFLSFYSPAEALELAREAGFRSARHLSKAGLMGLYFAGRADGFQPSSGEDFLVATV